MNVKVNINYPAFVNIKPGDVCVAKKYWGGDEKKVKVVKVVETESGVYVVFNDGTCRPDATYGKTWRLSVD